METTMNASNRIHQFFPSRSRQASVISGVRRLIADRSDQRQSIDVGQSFRRLAVSLLAVVFVVSQAPAQEFRSPGSGNATTLQTLPLMRARPITSSSVSAAESLDALTAPIYCDTQTLRSSSTIRAIRFWDSMRGIAVGDLGCILTTRDGGRTWTESISDVECRLNDATWIDANRVVAVGGGLDVVTRISRGTVVISIDGGQTWKRGSDSDLPRLHRIVRSADNDSNSERRARSITAHGDPDPVSGASLFKSRDGGRSWLAEVQDAPGDRIAGHASTEDGRITAEQSARWSALAKTRSVIRASCRLDEQTLLAAGDHGNILRSIDGGQTWETVHGDDASCAVLVIAGRQNLIPWSLIGRETLEKRLRVNIVVGSSADQDSDAITPGLEQATMKIGAAALDTFPLSSPPSSEDATAEALKQWIEVHHPPIIAIDASLNPKIKTLLLQHAVAHATGKVIEYSHVDRGETLLHHSAMLPQCGVLAGDFDDDCRLLVSDFNVPQKSATPNHWVSINTRYSSGNQFTHGDSLAVGVRLTSKHRLPPRVSKASRRRLQVIRGRLKQEVAIANLFGSVDGQQRPISSERFTQSMRLLLDQTSRIDQFRSAWSIARRSHGKRDQSIVWDELANRFPGSSAARLAGLHAKARSASIEWERHRLFMIDRDNSYSLRDKRAPIAAQIGGVRPIPDSSQGLELVPGRRGHAAIVSPFQSNTMDLPDSQHGVIQASASMPLSHRGLLGKSGQDRASPPSQDTSQIEVDLAWQMHPIRLIVEHAIDQNEQRSAFQRARTSDPISIDDSSSSESSTTDASLPRKEVQPTTESVSADLRRIAERQTSWAALLKPASPQIAIAVRVDSRPHLDGKLTESFWRDEQAKPATTRDEQGLQLRFAHDDQFVFVAVQTAARNFRLTDQSGKTGIRDADLSHADRVSVAFDVDRDLLTAMKIAFTRQGQTHDDIDGYPSWDPTWYFATHESEGVVTTEIAIEQSSLSATLQAGDSWFIEATAISSGDPVPFKMMPDAKSRVRVDFR
jgi:hypothetical protein